MIRATQSTEADEREKLVVDQRLLLHHVSQREYEAIGEALRDRPRLRMNFDGENLEIYTESSLLAPNLWTADTQRLLLHEIDWNDYESLLHAVDKHHLRTTYDQGSMEFMTLSPEHEGYKGRFNLFIQVLSEASE